MLRVLLFATLLVWSGLASAVVYKWVDAQGKVQYGDRPPDGVHAEVVELLSGHGYRPNPPPPSAAGGNAAGTPAKPPANSQSNASDGTRAAVDADVAEAKQKQCAEAQDRYRKLIEGRRLYRTGSDGERQYLSSEEIDSERLSAKHDVDVACNGPS
jgi:hypothetical protein